MGATDRRPGEGGPTEPFDATIKEIGDVLAVTPDGPEREALKAEFRAVEQARDGGPRRGVLELTEPTAPPAPPPPSPPAAAGGLSLPDLSDVAQQRAEDRRRGARVITTTTEA